ncbi:hypothetical protein Cgig2_003887 [Carnegiea gigantea]|uniref:Uncharacterized protein n=1 Tax=Carnegiea gigantea TaxID=171969 RepID=A0A9Q1JTS2_9CARY|nr:hypothetical protein Cgig2_003887 [Carnegiea gigantea]
MRADFMAAGLQSGCAALISAAKPLTCGHDIDVPEIMLKLTCRVSISSPVGPTLPVQPAKIFTPGAIKSGLSTSGVIGFGPLELNAATTGDGCTPNSVPEKSIVAVAICSDDMYFLISSPVFCPTDAAGIRLPLMQRLPFVMLLASPAYTRGSNFPTRGLPLYTDAPVKFFPFPKVTYAGKSRSSVPAPTVVIHGATLDKVPVSGPAFPAEQDMKIPFDMAVKAPTATYKEEKGDTIG